MRMWTRLHLTMTSLLVFSALGSCNALAQSKYDVGASDQEIRIGNILAYSGPVSSLGVIGKIEAAYFRKINDEGGINGRKINFISDRKSTRLNSSHQIISYAVFCLKKTTPKLDACPGLENSTEKVTLIERQSSRVLLEADLKCRGMAIDSDT